MSGAHLILNLNLLDFGFDTAWRLSSAEPTAMLDPDYLVDQAREAERGCFDAVFLSDGPGLREDPSIKPMRPMDPIAILALLAAETTHIGLVASMSTTFTDPHDLARKLLSLDLISGGRAAWNVVTTFSEAVSANFGISELPGRDERYQIAGAVVDEVVAYWKNARVQGLSPQGHPVIVQAGGSPQGQQLAARIADIVFSAELDVDNARRNRATLRADAVAWGRAPNDIRVLPGMTTVIGSTEAEAAERYSAFEEFALSGDPASRLAAVLGADLSGLDLDEPIPASVLDGPTRLDGYSGSIGFRQAAVSAIRSSNSTLRDAARRFGHLHHTVVGTPEQVADAISSWYETGAADGFNLTPDVSPDGLTIFVDEVVPILRRRGLVRSEYEETTLRDRLAHKPSHR